MTMFQKSMFGSSKAVGMFANRKGKQADLFVGLMPLRNDPPMRATLVGQTSFLDVAISPLAAQREDVAPVPTNEAAVPAPPLAPPAHPPAADCSPNVGDVATIIDLFSTAKANGLQWPKIRLALSADLPVVLSLVGSGNNAGKIRVTNGGQYGDPDNVFYGFIDVTGRFSGRDEAVIELLVKLAADPAGVAAEYGKGTGECCFCGRPLTNGKAGSVEVGYGPICAERFNLPWNPNGKDYEMVVGAPVGQVAMVEPCHECDSSGVCPECDGEGTHEDNHDSEGNCSVCEGTCECPYCPPTQPALPAPKPMLALPSPEPTPIETIIAQTAENHAMLLASYKGSLADEIYRQAGMVETNARIRQHPGISYKPHSPTDLKAGRSRIAKLRAKIAKLEASK